MSEVDDDAVLRMIGWVTAGVLVLAGVAFLLLAALTWGAGAGLPPLVAAIRGLASIPWHTDDPATAFPRDVRAMLPAGGAAWALGLAAATVASLVVAVGLWLDRARGRRWMAMRWYDPRARLTPRTFARPRDLRHLRARTDAWTMLRLDRRTIRTEPETHVLLVAPTRSGKTTGPVTTWTLEHPGPAVVSTTKTDIVQLTACARARQGPVWIYAPGVPNDALPATPCGWTPLDGCEAWERAQMVARWLGAAGITDTGQESDGARFYNREGSRVLAALMHAARLSGERMSTVNGWLRSESKEPMGILQRAGAHGAASRLEDFWRSDPRMKSFTIATAGQLIDAYEYPSIAATDREDFTAEKLLSSNGTLYLVAPESRQDLVRPLFAAVVSSIFRAAEMHALAHGPLDPPLRMVLDETASLVAIDDLPRMCSLSRGWGVRIATVWQNLDQIASRYGKGSEEILGASLAKLVLGPIQDQGTRDYLVRLLDSYRTDSPTYDVDELGSRRVRSSQDRDEAKVTAQTLQQLGRGEGLLVHGRDLPAKGRVLAWWEQRSIRARIVEGL